MVFLSCLYSSASFSFWSIISLFYLKFSQQLLCALRYTVAAQVFYAFTLWLILCIHKTAALRFLPLALEYFVGNDPVQIPQSINILLESVLRRPLLAFTVSIQHGSYFIILKKTGTLHQDQMCFLFNFSFIHIVWFPAEKLE